jgi:hypothetical protein
MLQRGARQYLAQSRKGWVGYKTISEPGRAAHKMLVPVETVMFDILLAEPLSYSATNAQICSALI